jgi:hypothetical protein
MNEVVINELRTLVKEEYGCRVGFRSRAIMIAGRSGTVLRDGGVSMNIWTRGTV